MSEILVEATPQTVETPATESAPKLNESTIVLPLEAEADEDSVVASETTQKVVQIEKEEPLVQVEVTDTVQVNPVGARKFVPKPFTVSDALGRRGGAGKRRIMRLGSSGSGLNLSLSGSGMNDILDEHEKMVALAAKYTEEGKEGLEEEKDENTGENDVFGDVFDISERPDPDDMFVNKEDDAERQLKLLRNRKMQRKAREEMNKEEEFGANLASFSEGMQNRIVKTNSASVSGEATSSSFQSRFAFYKNNKSSDSMQAELLAEMSQHGSFSGASKSTGGAMFVRMDPNEAPKPPPKKVNRITPQKVDKAPVFTFKKVSK